MTRSKHPNYSIGKVNVFEGGLITSDGKDRRTPTDPLTIAFAASVAGDSIELGPGSYTITSALTFKSGVSLIGAGFGATTIVLNGFSMIVGSGVSGVTIEGVTVDASSTAVGIQTLSDSHEIKIKDCIIKDATSRCIEMTETAKISITNCDISGSTLDGIYGIRCGVHSTDSSKSMPPLVSNCFIHDNDEHGINFVGVHDALISGNSIEDNGIAGIRIQDPIQTLISGNQLERNNQAGGKIAEIVVVLEDASAYSSPYAYSRGQACITGNQFGGCERSIRIIGDHATAYDVIIDGNYFFSPDNTNISIFDYRVNYKVTIANNHFSNFTLTSQNAIFLDGQAAGIDGRLIVVRGNRIDNYYAGIVVQDCTNVKLIGNAVVDCTRGVRISGGTTQSVQGSGNVFDTNSEDDISVGTGTVTYDMYNSIVDGELVLVTSDAAVTPTLNSGVGVDGSANVLIRSNGTNENISNIT